LPTQPGPTSVTRRQLSFGFANKIFELRKLGLSAHETGELSQEHARHRSRFDAG